MNIASLLDRPEYVHAAINHFPLVGLLVAMVSLVCALALRNRTAVFAGLGLIAVLALSAWVVSYFGEEGYDRVLSMADEDGQAFLQYHQHLADRWIVLYYLCAGSAALGIGLGWKWPRTLNPLASITLLLAAASFIAGIFIARAGGQIRHREFRSGHPPEMSQPH
ncbi:MAG TPA: hypothetical protein VL361_13785 [Candidatus Limnocylindrales bacterium]|jgi:hypothetical protein|nr:hypothetical protein [Candidatus Limnocylindrales bacterium]